MSRSLLNQTVLPFLLFPPLTLLGLKYIWSTAIDTNYGKALTGRCAINAPDSFAVSYTDIPLIDAELCLLVTFFQDALQPSSLAYTAQLIFNAAPIPIFALIEASRSGRPFLLSAAVAIAIGLAYQRYSAGAVMPVYWTVFLASGAAQRPGTVTQAHAQATFFAFIFGYFLPSSAMVMYSDAWATALWQAFPLWLFLAQQFHLLVRPASKHPESGRRTIQGLYGLVFFLAALSHLTIVWPNRNHWPAIRDAFVPSFVTPEQSILNDQAAKNLLQWDGAFLFAGALFATLWFARDAGELAVLLVWNVTASLTVGPGAALAAVYAWREERVTPL